MPQVYNMKISDVTCIDELDFSDIRILKSSFHNVTFLDCELYDNYLNDCDTSNIKVIDCNLTGTTFDSCSFQNTEFIDSNLARAEFEDSELRCVTFNGESLEQSFFVNCTFSEVVFKKVNLTGVSFLGTDVCKPDVIFENVLGLPSQEEEIDKAKKFLQLLESIGPSQISLHPWIYRTEYRGLAIWLLEALDLLFIYAESAGVADLENAASLALPSLSILFAHSFVNKRNLSSPKLYAEAKRLTQAVISGERKLNRVD